MLCSYLISYLFFHFSLPKFRKGIVAFITCKNLSKINLDTPTELKKKPEKDKTFEHKPEWDDCKRKTVPRVRFDTHKCDITGITEIGSEEVRKYKNIQKRKINHLYNQQQLTFDIETSVVITQDEKFNKIVRFKTGHEYNQNCNIGLRYRYATSCRRTSL